MTLIALAWFWYLVIFAAAAWLVAESEPKYRLGEDIAGMRKKKGGDDTMTCDYYPSRHGKNNSLVYACILYTPYPESDEEYDIVVCHYTGAFIPRKESLILGAVVPQAKIPYLCHPLAGEARKRSVQIFHEQEQNCNTCRHLKRVEFDRRIWKPSGLMPGECMNEYRNPLYPRGGNKILFAPDDCMSQPCYEGRVSGVGSWVRALPA